MLLCRTFRGTKRLFIWLLMMLAGWCKIILGWAFHDFDGRFVIGVERKLSTSKMIREHFFVVSSSLSQNCENGRDTIILICRSMPPQGLLGARIPSCNPSFRN
jgi:hypothetical protein